MAGWYEWDERREARHVPAGKATASSVNNPDMLNWASKSPPLISRTHILRNNCVVVKQKGADTSR